MSLEVSRYNNIIHPHSRTRSYGNRVHVQIIISSVEHRYQRLPIPQYRGSGSRTINITLSIYIVCQFDQNQNSKFSPIGDNGGRSPP